jgi:hypothetical protein
MHHASTQIQSYIVKVMTSRFSDTLHGFQINSPERRAPGTNNVKRVQATPILRFTKCEEAILCLFNNLLSPILNNPCNTVHPVVEDALNFIESEFIPDLRNHLVNFIARVEFATVPDFSQHSKKPKVAGAYVW